MRAGELCAEVHGADLRYVRLGETEIVRRLHIAVRDRHWRTISPLQDGFELSTGRNEFALRAELRFVEANEGIDITCRTAVTGDQHGVIRCSLDWQAHAPCQYNRIGWCVLHPAECAGKPVLVGTPSAVTRGRLPATIGPQTIVAGVPQALFPPFTTLEIQHDDQVAARFEFEGDLFEIEDQRNWTDASFKTYSTPLSRGYPHAAEPGERVRQSVGIRLTGDVQAKQGHPRSTVAVTIGQGGHGLPLIGTASPHSGEIPTSRELELLRSIRLDHLRVDLDLTTVSWPDHAERGFELASQLGAPVELAVTTNESSQFADLAARIAAARVGVARVLAFSPHERVSTARTVHRARTHLGQLGPVIAGTRGTFADVNRAPPTIPLDGLAWPLTATTHADDDLSVTETATIHGETVRTARALANVPVHLGPIAFRSTTRGKATDPLEPVDTIDRIDRRQPSLLAAAWTVASAARLMRERAASVTYFETIGGSGLLESEAPGPRPAGFCARPGMVYPLFHVLADLCEWKSRRFLEATSTAPLTLVPLAVEGDGGVGLLVASLTPYAQDVTVHGLEAENVRVRTLSVETFDQATADPELFRSRREDLRGALPLALRLGPYSVARLDVDGHPTAHPA